MAFAEQEGAGDAEIIVVDNNSTDDTAETVETCKAALNEIIPVVYVHEPKQGSNAARNAGVRTAKGRIIAFLDDDAVPSNGWLTGVAELFETHKDAAAAGGPIEPEFETPRPDWLTAPLESYYTIVDLGSATIRFPGRMTPWGANMAFRAEALQGMSFPDAHGRKREQLFSNEETWLLERIRDKGGRLYYTPNMHVRHFVPKERLTQEWIRRRYYYNGISKAMLKRGPITSPRMAIEYMIKIVYLTLKRYLPLPRFTLVDDCRYHLAVGVFDGLLGRPPRTLQ